MAAGIDYFGRGSWLTKIQEHVSLGARRRMFVAWCAHAGNLRGKRVLDVGTTPDRERSDSNCMLPWLHDEGVSVHLYSPEEISDLTEIFPFAKVVPSRGFGSPIPVADRAYDWSVASAVIEHVGGVDAQRDFISDCARTADGFVITTPNRWHWLEFHTKLPLIHWAPRPVHRALLRLLGKQMWARESHLRLLDRRELNRLAEEAVGAAFDVHVEVVWALGMPSNLILFGRRRPSGAA